MISYVDLHKYIIRTEHATQVTWNSDKNQVKANSLQCSKNTKVSGRTIITMEKEPIKIIQLEMSTMVLLLKESIMGMENWINGTTAMRDSISADWSRGKENKLMIGQKTKDKMYVEGMNIMGNFLKTNFKEKASLSPEILSIATKGNSIKECLAVHLK